MRIISGLKDDLDDNTVRPELPPVGPMGSGATYPQGYPQVLAAKLLAAGSKDASQDGKFYFP